MPIAGQSARTQSLPSLIWRLYRALLAERTAEIFRLHMRLEEAIEANHRMARIADRDRLRAETAERERGELMAEVGRLRALADF